MDRGDVAALVARIGDRIEDATEETFLLFSQDLPANNLGILEPTATTVDVELAGRTFTITQSPGLLRSTREAGTTGAVLWKIAPRLAGWLASPQSILWQCGLVKSSSIVLELGCGIAGVVGLALAPLVATYILSDQEYVMKLLRDNVAANAPALLPHKAQPRSVRRGTVGRDTLDNLKLLTLDWERDAVDNVRRDLQADDQIELLVLSDCIYNTFLIDPLVQTCREICQMHPEKTTLVLIAQQVRTDAVVEQWLSTLLQSFVVWRPRDEHLPATLNSASGYVIHLALLRTESMA